MDTSFQSSGVSDALDKSTELGRKTGIISFANGSRQLECTIRNSSASFAELSSAEVGSVPHRFELQEGPDAPRRAVRVIWRKPGVLGVRFDEYFLRR
jgi:hypothetical protein